MIDDQATLLPSDILDTDFFKESSVLDFLPVSVYVCDTSGKIIRYNGKATEMWGRVPSWGDKDEIFNGTFRLFYPDGEHMPHSSNPLIACLKDGMARKNHEIILERPDGSRMVARVSIAPIKNIDGDVVGLVNCFDDITEQTEAQKALDRKTRELEDYVENASVGLHWVNENGTIIWANKAELSMLGYSPDEYIGHHISEFHVDPARIEDILYRLRSNETLNGYESVVRCKDGSTRTVQISSNVYRENGSFIHTRCFTVDVTEQKNLYRALLKSEAQYRNLVDTIPAGIYTCDLSGKITYFNDAAAALWGYRPDLQDSPIRFCACAKVWTMDGNYVPPEKTPMAIALETGRSFHNMEALAERPDGSRFYANIHIEPLYDEHQNRVGAINVFQDITPIREAEIAVRESEARYRNLIQSLDTPLYTTDKEGRITLYNKAAADLWGREPEIGKDLWCGSYQIFRPDGSDLPLDSCPMAVCLKERRAVRGEEIIIKRPDGVFRNVAPHPQPLFDGSGNMIGAINMLIDITAIKQAEQRITESEHNYRSLAATLEKRVQEKTHDLQHKNEELRQSEERYHRMVEEVEDYAIILLDKDGTILNWNKGAEKIKGYKEEEIIGRNFEIFYLPEDREQGVPQKIIQEATLNGKKAIEGWRLRKDGSRFWGSIVVTALHNDQGTIIGFTKVTRDLTERKLAEDRLREYSTELEFRNKELEQFAYAASHDMKEPLRKINIYGAYIKDNKSNKLDSRSMDYLERSLNAASRMGKLIDDLLAYSRTTSTVESYTRVDMNAITDEVILEYKDEIAQKDIEVSVGKLPGVTGIPFQLRQLMINLIGNAIKYRDETRKCRIRIDSDIVTASHTDALKLTAGHRYHRISVEDNGTGFEQEYAGKIFEIFQRLGNKVETKGSGIGLAICKKIVQNHKGQIAATGSVNQGARFDIYLPAGDQY